MLPFFIEATSTARHQLKTQSLEQGPPHRGERQHCPHFLGSDGAQRMISASCKANIVAQ